MIGSSRSSSSCGFSSLPMSRAMILGAMSARSCSFSHSGFAFLQTRSASLCCAFYAFKIEKLHGGKGFAMLKDDDGTEPGVAE